MTATAAGAWQDRYDLPRPPAFATVEEERGHRRRRLVTVLRLFSRLGFEEGGTGHVTVRDPEHTDRFWVNPLGRSYATLTEDDLLLVDGAGDVVEGRGPVSLAAFAIHAAIHHARPDVVAAAHAHTLHGKAFSSLGRPLDPLTQDACAFFEDHAIFEEYSGVVVDAAHGARLAAALGTGKALIHVNHGLVTVGETVDEAAWWLISMERSCQAQLLAEAAGSPRRIDPGIAREAAVKGGSHYAGWFAYQLFLERFRAEEPHLFPHQEG